MVRTSRFILAAAAFALLAACGWGTDGLTRAVLEKGLEGDTEFLRKADFSAIDAKRLIRLRPGSAYYLAFIFRDLARDAEAESLFQDTFRRDTDPWRREAGLELAGYMVRSGSADDLIALARRFRLLYPEDVRGRLLALRALYERGRDGEVLAEAGEILRGGTDGHEEALLFRSLAERRTGGEAWPDSVRELFRSFPAGGVHRRAYDELVAGSANGIFRREEMVFFRARVHRAEGEWEAARPGYRLFPDGFADSPVILREYGDILQKTGRYQDGIRDLENLIPGLENEALAAAEEYLGRLYRLSGRHDKSIVSLRKALRALPESSRGRESDRIIWYLLSSSLRRSTDGMLNMLPEYLPLVHDTGYFSDLFEALSSALVREGKWADIHRVFEMLGGRAEDRDSGRYAFLLAMAAGADLYRSASLPPVRELFETAAVRGEPYYAILASAALGSPAGPRTGSRETPRFSADYSPQDLLVQGFVDFRLSRRGVETARGLREALSRDTLVRLAESEAAMGRYIDSLRLLHRSVRREDFRPDRRTLEAMYPLAFPAEMDSAVTGTAVPPAIFRALVREESYFDPAISSWAGAVGLAQLMPATAGDIARKLRLEAPDLTDPLTNLRLGSRYFRDLLNRFGTGVHALAGYNAGSSRVSRWKKQHQGLPGVLFAEAIPFAETREYIRKVLVSAVHYGYLYHDTAPSETVSEIFSDFPPEPPQEHQ